MAESWADLGVTTGEPQEDWSDLGRPPNPTAVKARKRTPAERFKDNAEDAYRRGTLVGSGIDALVGGVGGDSAKAENRESREMFEITSKADPFHKAGNPVDVVVAGGATLAGQLVGSIPSPESWVGLGPGSLVKRAAGNASVNAAADVPTQGLMNVSGAQEGYDPARTVGSAVIGAAIPVGFDGTRAVGNLVVKGVQRLRGPKKGAAEDWSDMGRTAPAEEVADWSDLGAPTKMAPEAPAAATTAKAALDAPKSQAPATRQPEPLAAVSEVDARQVLREILPEATITSGRRDPAKNAAVGGAAKSWHLHGQALDFVPPKGTTIAQVRAALEARGLPVTELLDEGDHFHWAWGGGRGAAPRDPIPTRTASGEFEAIPTRPFEDTPGLTDREAGFTVEWGSRAPSTEPEMAAAVAARAKAVEDLAPPRQSRVAVPSIEPQGARIEPRAMRPGPESPLTRAEPSEPNALARFDLDPSQNLLARAPQGPTVANRLAGLEARGVDYRTAEVPTSGLRASPLPNEPPGRLAMRDPRAAIDLSAYGDPVSAGTNPGGLRAAPRPGGVLRGDSPGQFAGATVSQLAGRLRTALGVPHRQGRVMRGAVGEYDPKTAVIRTKKVQELDVLAHEATHALEFKGGPNLKGALQAHDAELRTLAYPGANPAHMREEGFAEFGRWYLTNPDHARKLAPRFYDAFEAALQRDHPQIAGDFKAIQAAYQDFLRSPSLDTAAASIAYTGNPGPIRKMQHALRERGFRGVVKDLLDDAYTAFIDDLHPIAKAVRELQETYAENHGKRLDLKAAKNPYALARLSREAYAAGHIDLMHGVVPYHGIDPEGPSLSQALELALGEKQFGKWSKKSLEQLDAYLVARRMVHEWDRYKAGDLENVPDRNSKEYHEAIIRDAEAANPTWSDAAQLVYQWLGALWKKELDAGLITPESYKHGLEAHPDYVPLMRDMSDQSAVGPRGRPRGAMQFAGGVKQFTGSTRDVISPLSSMMRRAYELNAIIKRNDAIKALDDLAEAAGPGAGRIVERLPAQEVEAINVDAIEALSKAAQEAGLSERDVTTLVQAADAALDGQSQATIFRQRDVSPRKGEAVVFVWRDGKKTPLLLADGEFGQSMFTALTGMNRDLQSGVVDAMAAATQTLRYGVTLSPEFMSRNYVRDQLAVWINTDVGFTPVVDSLRGMASELRRTPEAIRYGVAGGMRGGANVAATRKPFPQSDKEALAQLQHLRQKGYKVRRFASWRGLAEMTDLSETSTRIGVYGRAFKQAKKRGLADREAMLEAAYTSRDYLDFGRRGAKMLSAVRLVTFLNASIQSLDKTTRVLTAGGNLHNVLAPLGKNAPRTDSERRALAHAYKAWAKVSALGMFGLALRMLYADDPEYQEIGDRLRATHWIAKVEGRWIFIPKPFELATLSNIFERAYEAGALKDPKALERLLGDFSHTIAPPHEIPAVSVPFAIAANRDYQGRPIVPDRLRGTVDPHLQFNSYTSEFGKAVGKALGVSPAVVDYVVTGVGGSLGRYGLQLTNMGVEAATGKPRTDSGPEDMFLSRGFVRHVSRGSTSQKEFWDLVSKSGGELTRAEGTFRAYMSAGDDKAATAYLNKLSPAARGYVQAKVFSQGGSSSYHPIVRAQKAVSVIGNLRQQARKDELMTVTGQPIPLDASQRRTVDDALADLAMVEMRNALISAGVEGWGNKEPISRDRTLERIRRASPDLADALVKHIALGKVPDEHRAAEFWKRQRPRFEAPASPEQLGLRMRIKRLRSPDRMDRMLEIQRARQAQPNALAQ